MELSNSVINLWANFLFNEKLDPKKINEEDVLDLIELCVTLSKIRRPRVRPYKDRLESRRLIVSIAMDLGIDLAGIRHKVTKKYLIGRGLLNMWNKICVERYGSIHGTQSLWEAKRRDVKTRLSRNKTHDQTI